ncbi:MAG TPA: PilZ domain-containing protein [Terracidiphilus sp.]|nr:PilZ domain-containing protein [Terracidiphilus sp.]
MEATRYKVEDKTQGSAVSSGVSLVNSTREPLTALRVMVEGLGAGEEAGLWLTQVTTVPMVPRISPFDLVYLDASLRVVACVELLPATEIPRFKKPASSALILPFRTISTAQIAVGDELACDEVVEAVPAVEAAAKEPEAVQPVQAAVAIELVSKRARVAEQDLPLLNPFLVREAASAKPLASEPAQIDIRKSEDFIPAKSRDEFVLTDYLRAEGAKRSAGEEEPAQPATTRMFIAPKRGAAKQHVRREPSKRSVPQKAEPPQSTTAGKKPKVDRLFRWLYPALYDQNRRSADRIPSQGLVAYDFTGNDEARMHEVVNVSSHGLYLRTDVPLEAGAALSLTLQINGPFESESQARVEFDCSVVRIGEDGFGMSILLPEGMALKLWEAPGRNGADETDPHCILRELRMARALAFMRRICPAANEQMTDLFHKTLSNVRANHIVEVALRAERILAEEPDAYCMAAHPDLILRILEHGSWVDVDWLQDLWAGLLATSCTFEGQDESNLVYINLLSRLAPLPTQILAMACAKAVQSMTESARPALPACSAEEIASITRSNNLMKIYKSIGELSELGLMEKNPRTVSPANPEAAKALPTQLGLNMFARCNGQRGVTMAA